MPSPFSGRSITFDRSTSRLSLESAQKYVATVVTTSTVTRVIAVHLMRRRQSGAGRSGP
ncbi:hypothetical protein SUDANB66_03787 [Streptomyces sp. SudanB66_2053]